MTTTIAAAVTVAGHPVEDHIREVTEEEVVRFERDGWVKLERLITEELAEALLQAARIRGGDAGIAQALAHAGTWVDVRVAPQPGGELFAAYAWSKKMGCNASKLINRARLTDEKIAVRYFADAAAARAGNGHGPSTHFHQDYVPLCHDREGAINIWMALSAIGPDQGGMTFLTGSHHEARLGPLYIDGIPDARHESNRRPALADTRLPKLATLYELAPGAVYRPGDATVHSGYTVHGAPANMTAEPRWNYVVSYVPDDVRYSGLRIDNGLPNRHIYGDEEMTIGQRFDLDRFPVVYP